MMARTDPRPHYGQRLPRVTPDGYIEEYRPDHPLSYSNGYVLVHRAVAWDTGIMVDPRDEVHHINHVRDDNRPENLEAKTKESHALDHAEERGQVTNQYGTFSVKPRGQRNSDLYPSAGAPPRSERDCTGCDGKISSDKRLDARFCSDRCAQKDWARRQKVS